MSLYKLHALPYNLLLFFFNDTATTEIYTLSLHDALPILALGIANIREGEAKRKVQSWLRRKRCGKESHAKGAKGDRKSTRLNSSHGYISYAVFCLKKKKKQILIEHDQRTTQ